MLSEEQKSTLREVKAHPELQPLFFGALKGLHWFSALREMGYFKLPSDLAPVISEDGRSLEIKVWPVLLYLERTAPELEIPENASFQRDYLGVVREVTEAQIRSDSSNFRTWWYFARIVKHIDVQYFAKSDANLFAYWLKDSVGASNIAFELAENLFIRLVGNDSKIAKYLAVVLLDRLTEITWAPNRRNQSAEPEPWMPLESYFANELFSKKAKQIGAMLEIEGIDIFRNRFEELWRKLGRDKYSSVWRPSVADDDRNRGEHELSSIYINATRDGLLGYVDRHAAQAATYVRSLLTSTEIMTRRIAIYVIGECYESLANIVPEILKPNYFTVDYRAEVMGLLNRRFAEFEDDWKRQAIDIIKALPLPRGVSDNETSEHEQRLAALRLGWLIAIKNCGDTQVQNIFDHDLKIAGYEPEYPERPHMNVAGWIVDSSPYDANELLSRETKDLVVILQSFVETGEWKAPTRTGLARELTSAVRAHPDAFAGKLRLFRQVPIRYVQAIVEGFVQLWSETKHDNWDELLRFCLDMVDDINFWSVNRIDAGEDPYARGSLVSSIARAVKAGTVEDSKVFDPRLLPVAKRMLRVLLDRQPGSVFGDCKDAVTVAINSPRGQCVEAFLNLALRWKRVVDSEASDGNALWNQEFKEVFEKESDQLKQGNLEYATLFARYIPNLLYLNKEWTSAELPKVFDMTNALQWGCAMDGYSYVSQVFATIYEYLASGDHFKLVFERSDLNSHVKKKVIQNIVVAYVYEYEDLANPNGHIGWLVNRWKEDELSELAWFVWTMREGVPVDKRQRVVGLWERLVQTTNADNKADQRLLSRLCLWSVYIDKIDDKTRPLLSACASFADRDHNTHILLEQLSRLVDSNPEGVADILLALVKRVRPDYRLEEFFKVLQSLLRGSGAVRMKGTEIRDEYIKKGGLPPSEVMDL